LHTLLCLVFVLLLLTSTDSTVRRLAESGLKAEASMQRKKFLPATIVRDTLQHDPGMSRRTLKVAAKRAIAEEENHTRLSEVQSLPRQGHMSCTATASGAASIWADVIKQLPDEQFKFSLNAAHDTLPHNSNLHLWGKKDDDICPLCLKDSQNLVHVLNSCQVARDLRRYNARHDAVLGCLYDVIRDHLPATASASDS